MSDLSKVLGDLYDDSEPTPAERRFQPTAPEWADEERLDEAFSGWTPGPPAEAHAMEREMGVVIDTPYVPAARLDEDLAATLSEALVDAGRDNAEPEVPVAAAPSYALPGYDDEPLPLAAHMPTYESVPVEEPEPVFEPVVESVSSRPWSRGDDDIIPGKAGPVAKAPKVKLGKKDKAPKAEKVPKPEKPAGESKKFFGVQLRK